MAGNPFLKADDKTLRISGNFASIVFVDKQSSYDPATGSVSADIQENTALIPIGEPKGFSEFVVDGKNYASGDLKFEVSYLALSAALPSSRKPDFQSCGVNKENDYFQLGTVKYSIVKIEPANVWQNTPSKYKFHIRMM